MTLTHPTLSLTLFQFCFLYQHVRQPTRFRLGEASNVLDLVFTDEEGMVANLTFLPGLGNSDHIILSFDLVCFSTPKPQQRTRTCTDYRELEQCLSVVDWSQMDGMTLAEASKFFH